MAITPEQAAEHIASLPGVIPAEAWGETAFFYNPGQRFARGTYFATIKQADGANDSASRLDRDGVWRLNIGPRRETFLALFGPPPPRPMKGQTIAGDWDFTRPDVMMPHPVYGWMGWIAILSPGEQSWQRCQALISDAHDRASATFQKRLRQQN